MLRSYARSLSFLTALSVVLPACSGGDDAPGTEETTTPDAGDTDSQTSAEAQSPEAEAAASDAQGVGTLSGTAQLFGLSKHAGIKVAVEGTTLEATTDDTGKFVLPAVPAGSHKLVASFAPYATERREGVVVEAEGNVKLDTITLHLAALMRAGNDSVPLAFTGVADHALYFADFSPYLGTGTLWSARPADLVQTKAGDSVAPPGVVVSPDGSRVAVLSNFAVGSGIGDLSLVDLATATVHPLEKGVAIGAVGFTQDGNWLVYAAKFDMMTGIGDLRLFDCAKSEDHLLGSSVPFNSVQVSKDGKQLVYGSGFSITEYTADLYMFELGSGQPELVDEDVYLPMRWTAEDWSVMMYLKGPINGQSGTLRLWESSTGAAKTLGSEVPAESVTLAPDWKSALFLTSYDATAMTGALNVWKSGVATPEPLDDQVSVYVNLTPDLKRVLYNVAPDPVTYQGTLTAFDFVAQKYVTLATQAGPFKWSTSAPKLAYFDSWDQATSTGELFVYDFETEADLPVAVNASNNAFDLDPQGRYVLFQKNPDAGTYQGDLWIHELATSQSTELAVHALPSVRISADGSMFAFFSEPDADFRTALGNVWRLSDHKKAALGRISFLQEQLLFREDAGLVAFFKNPSPDATKGDLWVWDPAKDQWTGQDLGMQLGTAAYTWGVKFRSDALTFVHDMNDLGDVGSFSHWSATTRKVTPLASQVMLGTLQGSEDGSRMLYMASGASFPRGDLYLIDMAKLATTQLGTSVHQQSLWVDPSWKRSFFIADGSGDLGNLTIADLTTGAHEQVGTDVPFFGVRASTSGNKVAYVAGWDTVQAVGRLFVDDMTDQAPAIPVDEPSPLTFLISDKHLMYVVKGASAPADARNGIYLAPLP